MEFFDTTCVRMLEKLWFIKCWTQITQGAMYNLFFFDMKLEDQLTVRRVVVLEFIHQDRHSRQNINFYVGTINFSCGKRRNCANARKT